MQASVTKAHGQSCLHTHIGNMKVQSNIVIAGGGLNGTTLALALANSGLSVTLVDPVPPVVHGNQKFDGRGYALAISSQRLLSILGVWADVAQHAQPILHVKITDGSAGQGPSPWVLEFDHTEIEESPMGYMIEDRFLRRALLSGVQNHPDITHVTEDSVVQQQPDEAFVNVTLTSGRTLKSNVLIGCDGRSSGTAKRAKISRTGWGYDQTALVCAIEHERAHDGIAHQYFLPPGPLAILPLPGDKSSIVWTESTIEANRIQALDDTDYLDTLRPRFGRFLGDISLAGARFSYPLSLTVADRFVTERVALVGDAAHGMHPIAGQGLNAGFKDIAALAEVLTLARRRGEDIGRLDVLQRYQQWRRFDTATLAAATDGFNRLFSNDNDFLRMGRDIGLGVANALPSLRRMFIREAAGLTGDMPKLLQGRAI